MPNPLSARMVGRLALTGAFMFAVGATSAVAGEVVVSQGARDVRTIEVKVADLDLTRAYDRDTLEIRVNKAARRVCDVHGGSKLDRMADARGCVAEAKNGAMAQLAAGAHSGKIAVSART